MSRTHRDIPPSMHSRSIRHDSAYPEVSPRVVGSDADAVEDDRRAQMGEEPACRALTRALCWLCVGTGDVVGIALAHLVYAGLGVDACAECGGTGIYRRGWA